MESKTPHCYSDHTRSSGSFSKTTKNVNKTFVLNYKRMQDETVPDFKGNLGY